MNPHEISEYIENLPLQKAFCKGYRPDEVYEVICNLSSMYNQILSESYEENDELKRKLEYMEAANRVGNPFMLKTETATQKRKDEKALEHPQEEKNPMPAFEEKTVVFEEKQEEPMTDKELQKLKRGELLEILLEQSRENEALKIQLEESSRMIETLKAQLESRKIDIKQAGTIADASFKLNGVFEAAEKAAQQYLENLQDLYQQEASSFSQKEAEVETKCAALLQATKERCESMKEDTARECNAMREATEKECREREQAAEENCAALDLKAKEDVDKRWDELSKRLEAFYNAHEGLKDIMAASKMI